MIFVYCCLLAVTAFAIGYFLFVLCETFNPPIWVLISIPIILLIFGICYILAGKDVKDELKKVNDRSNNQIG
jgi:hypothetical protein